MKIQLSLILAAALLFAACDKKETQDDNWKETNEAQFAKITTSQEYKRINSESSAGHIMYKVITQGNGATPYFTDKVKVLYTGWFKYDWLRGDSYKNDRNETVVNKYVFDSTESRNNVPAMFDVNPQTGVIDGFSTALQHMKVGDKWEIWIPWKLGYGTSGKDVIRPYTTLVFEVELLDIVK
jgi:peptidylprolyl isomerase/FKBP-type peptidyl-prolyl cis-trans isomerase FklB